MRIKIGTASTIQGASLSVAMKTQDVKELQRAWNSEKIFLCLTFQEPNEIHLKTVQDRIVGSSLLTKHPNTDEWVLTFGGVAGRAKPIIDKFGEFGRTPADAEILGDELVIQIPGALNAKLQRVKPKPAGKAKGHREPKRVPEPVAERLGPSLAPERAQIVPEGNWVTSRMADPIEPGQIRAVKRAIDFIEKETFYQLKLLSRADGTKFWAFTAPTID